MILSRILAGVAILSMAAPATARIDDWSTDDWDDSGSTSGSGYDPADGATVRRQLAEVGRLLDTGLAALETDDWNTAQYQCAMADNAASRTDYSNESAFVEGRTIARTCIGDAAYGKGNTGIACEWWAKVEYESFIWEDPYAICSEE